MKTRKLAWWLFLTFVGAAAAGPAPAAGLPAFPGAEGGGAFSQGGRGGRVIFVTTLEDNGDNDKPIPGSLRAAVRETGPRTVVFRVGGSIKLKKPIALGPEHSFLTIAGQTAPGGGIEISGAEVEGWSSNPCASIAKTPLIFWGAEHIVMRYVRVRAGRGIYEPCPGGPDAIAIASSAKNIILDHVSVFWGQDENINIHGRGAEKPVRNITIQNSIIAEPLMYSGSSATNVMVTRSGQEGLLMYDIDMLRNYLVNASHRNAAFGVQTGRFVNNLVYSISRGMTTRAGAMVDIIGNHFETGTANLDSNRLYDIATYTGEDSWQADQDSACHTDPVGETCRVIMADPSLYVSGNRGRFSWQTARADDDNWPMVRRMVRGPNTHTTDGAPVEWRRHDPLPAPNGLPISVMNVVSLETDLIPWVGASRRLDCEGNWVNMRDFHDQRVVADFLNGTGGKVRHEDEVGGFLGLEGGDPCVDTIGDGIPDAWSITNGLDPLDPSLAARVHNTGYTFLELYLSGMRPGIAPAEAPRIVVE